MTKHTIIIRSPVQRQLIKEYADKVPLGFIVEFKQQARSTEQNSKLWAMLSDVSRTKPEGHEYTADDWKCLFMNACGHETQFVDGLDGRPFPTGFKSSKLNTAQMRELIEFIYEYGARHGVKWSEPVIDERAYG